MGGDRNKPDDRPSRRRGYTKIRDRPRDNSGRLRSKGGLKGSDKRSKDKFYGARSIQFRQMKAFCTAYLEAVQSALNPDRSSNNTSMAPNWLRRVKSFSAQEQKDNVFEANELKSAKMKRLRGVGFEPTRAEPMRIHDYLEVDEVL